MWNSDRLQGSRFHCDKGSLHVRFGSMKQFVIGPDPSKELVSEYSRIIARQKSPTRMQYIQVMALLSRKREVFQNLLRIMEQVYCASGRNDQSKWAIQGALCWSKPNVWERRGECRLTHWFRRNLCTVIEEGIKSPTEKWVVYILFILTKLRDW